MQFQKNPIQFYMLLYLLIILLLVVLPLNNSESFLNNTYIVKIRLDYLGHVILFLPFVFLLRLASRVKFGIACLLGIGYALFTESLQFYLPYRSFNINDMIANALGVLMGLVLLVPVVSSVLARILGVKKQ